MLGEGGAAEEAASAGPAEGLVGGGAFGEGVEGGASGRAGGGEARGRARGGGGAFRGRSRGRGQREGSRRRRDLWGSRAGPAEARRRGAEALGEPEEGGASGDWAGKSRRAWGSRGRTDKTVSSRLADHPYSTTSHRYSIPAASSRLTSVQLPGLPQSGSLQAGTSEGRERSAGEREMDRRLER